MAGLISSLAPDRPNLPTFIRKVADESVANSTVVQNDDDFFFDAEPDAAYLVEIDAIISSPANAGFKFVFSGPAGYGVHGYHMALGNSDVSVGGAGSFTSERGFVRGDTMPALRIFAVIVTAATPGMIRLRWAQSNTSPSPTQIFARSVMSILRVG